MGYLALYREWRPQAFEQVVGQVHVTRTLKNSLSRGHLSHAYLFCGPRGTGKTSVARILAKAVNCMSFEGPGPEPCNACLNCREITGGTSLDVLEIDAASNRGIDEVRDLREKARYSPLRCRYKVYIIDEVHMLTDPAFNALLKTLEEPPPHVLFVLATTEPQKVPLTIASRCQRFDFHRLGAREIASRLREVCRRQELEAEEEALALIARYAEGSLRDALGLLDQCMAFGEGRINLDDVINMVGSVKVEALEALAEGVKNGDAGGCLRLLQNLINQGKDERQLARDLTHHFRQLLLVKICREPDELLEVPESSLARLRAQAEGFREEELLGAVRLLAAAEGEMRWSPQPRLTLEIALVRLAAREELRHGQAAETDRGGDQPGDIYGGLLQRIERLEETLNALKRERKITTVPQPPASPLPPVEATRGREAANEAARARQEQARPRPEQVRARQEQACARQEQVRARREQAATKPVSPPLPPGRAAVPPGDMVRRWTALLAALQKRSRPAWASLAQGRFLEVDGDCLVVAVPSQAHKEMLEKPERQSLLRQVAREIWGADYHFRLVVARPREGPSGGGAGNPDGPVNPVVQVLEIFEGEEVEL